jgi:hypothetical protein
MGIIGTGIAAGVAATAQQAEHVSRRRKRVKTESKEDAKRIRDEVESHLLALDEGDGNNSATQLRIDENVPEHQRPSELLDALHKASTNEASSNSSPEAALMQLHSRNHSAIDSTNPANETPNSNASPASEGMQQIKAAPDRSENPASANDTSQANAPKNTQQPPAAAQLYKHLDITA